MRRTALLLASTALTVLLASGMALAAPASFDASFGGDGRVTTDFSPPEDPRDESAYDVVVQPDGKILVGGDAQADQTGNNGGLAMSRYDADGSLDTSFGADGKVTDSNLYGAYDVGLQSDGKIVALDGEKLSRYGADGSPDTSFGSNGTVAPSLCPSSARAGNLSALAIQDDDKILVAGSCAFYEGNNYRAYVAVARYDANGSPDTAFHMDGALLTDLGGYTNATAIAVDSQGKIFVAGNHWAQSQWTGYADFALVKYAADGSLDNSLDGDGKLVSYVTSKDDFPSSLALQEDGKIVVAGEANYNGALVRHNADGSLDTSFNSSGKVLNTNASRYSDVALQEDGKIVAQGNYGFGLWRHNADGTVDTSFRGDDYRWGYEYSYGLALQDDGKIVQAGSVENASGFSDFGVARSLGAFTDAAKPTGSVTIDQGRRVTRDRSVELTLDANDPSPGSGVTKMRIKNAGSSWSSWTRYAESKDWNITRKAGTKTVYVQYRDAADNISASAKDSITYRP